MFAYGNFNRRTEVQFKMPRALFEFFLAQARGLKINKDGVAKLMHSSIMMLRAYRLLALTDDYPERALFRNSIMNAIEQDKEDEPSKCPIREMIDDYYKDSPNANRENVEPIFDDYERNEHTIDHIIFICSYPESPNYSQSVYEGESAAQRSYSRIRIPLNESALPSQVLAPYLDPVQPAAPEVPGQIAHIVSGVLPFEIMPSDDFKSLWKKACMFFLDDILAKRGIQSIKKDDYAYKMVVNRFMNSEHIRRIKASNIPNDFTRSQDKTICTISDLVTEIDREFNERLNQLDEMDVEQNNGHQVENIAPQNNNPAAEVVSNRDINMEADSRSNISLDLGADMIYLNSAHSQEVVEVPSSEPEQQEQQEGFQPQHLPSLEPPNLQASIAGFAPQHSSSVFESQQPPPPVPAPSSANGSSDMTDRAYPAIGSQIASGFSPQQISYQQHSTDLNTNNHHNRPNLHVQFAQHTNAVQQQRATSPVSPTTSTQQVQNQGFSPQ